MGCALRNAGLSDLGFGGHTPPVYILGVLAAGLDLRLRLV